MESLLLFLCFELTSDYWTSVGQTEKKNQLGTLNWASKHPRRCYQANLTLELSDGAMETNMSHSLL